MKRSKNDVLYGGETDERLICESEDEYIEQYISHCYEIVEGETLRVIEYARKKIPVPTMEEAEVLLEGVLEDLDEEHGDPDGERFDLDSLTEKALLKDAKKFLEKIYRAYVPWEMEPTGKESLIDLSKWEKEK